MFDSQQYGSGPKTKLTIAGMLFSRPRDRPSNAYPRTLLLQSRGVGESLRLLLRPILHLSLRLMINSDLKLVIKYPAWVEAVSGSGTGTWPVSEVVARRGW